MPRPVAYKTGTIQPPNTAKQSNILVGIAPANWGAGAANATFYNGLDSSYQYVIIKNSNPPVMWGTGDFTTGSLLTTINGLPDRVGQTSFTNPITAISWSLASGNYTILKNEQVYGGPITSGLSLGFNNPQKNCIPNGNFNDGTFNPFYYTYNDSIGVESIVDITNDKPYVNSISTKAMKMNGNGGRWLVASNMMELGKTYTFSFWAKITNGSSYTVAWNSQNGSGDTNNWQGSAALTTSWQKYTQTFVYNLNRYYFFFYTRTNLQPLANEAIFTELQVEEG